SLDQLHRLETRVSVLADDEMVVHGNPERPRDLDDRPRHVDIGARGRRIAGGMVVHQDDRGGGELERALDHFARVDGVWSTVPVWCCSSAMRWLALSRNRMRKCSLLSKPMAARQ